MLHNTQLEKFSALQSLAWIYFLFAILSIGLDWALQNSAGLDPAQPPWAPLSIHVWFWGPGCGRSHSVGCAVLVVERESQGTPATLHNPTWNFCLGKQVACLFIAMGEIMSLGNVQVNMAAWDGHKKLLNSNNKSNVSYHHQQNPQFRLPLCSTTHSAGFAPRQPAELSSCSPPAWNGSPHFGSNRTI